ncbi:MAG TPA: ATP-binding protein [Vicinamibacteria bacterium]|nr:ATP-binding protein [Vicinamibacteria bacterium]
MPQPLTPEEREHLARNLRLVLGLLLPALAAGSLITWLLGSRAAIAVAVATLPMFLLWRLPRRGRVYTASFVLPPALLALATWLLVQGSGLQDIAVLLYPVILLVAALLLERRPFVLLTVLALLSLGFVAWGQARGFVRLADEAARPRILANFLLAALMLCVAAAMVHLLAEDLRVSLRAARRSEERYRLISEVTSDYTFSSVVDAAGRVRQDWVAGAFEKMTGYSFDEYMARGGWRTALHPDDHAQDDRDLETLKAHRPVVTEVRTITRSGDVRWVRVYGHPVWNEAENRLAGIYGAVKDVTEAKQAEAEREALIRELAAKNAELERFTYTASHDLKSPLVTVRGFLAFLERDALEGNHEQLREGIRRIERATERMARLVDELLALSRVGRLVGPARPTPFGELAEEAASLVAGRIEQRGARVRIADDLPVVWGDRSRLVQVVQNLLDNAVKFMGDQKDPVIEIGVRRQGAEPVLFVRDNGAGIAAGDQERVFGLFDKLDPEGEGAGVGLALVKRIVELHGGRIWVESEGPGRGSAFCFTLPPAPAAP